MKQTRHYKRILAAILAAVLMVAMSLTAFATGEDAGDGGSGTRGKITITNAQKGVTYKAYKIFDVTYAPSGDVLSYSYTIEGTSPWYSTVSAYAGDAGNKLILSKSAGSDTYVVSTDKGFSAANFAKALQAAVADKTEAASATADADGTMILSEDLDLGYYLIMGTNAGLCSLNTTDPDAEVTDKNDVPFDKDLTGVNGDNLEVPTDSRGVTIGSVLTYTITGRVPDTEGFDEYIYIAEDTMDLGLTMNVGSVTVNIGGTKNEETGNIEGGTPVNLTSDTSDESGTAPAAGDMAKNTVYYKAPKPKTEGDPGTGGGFKLRLNMNDYADIKKANDEQKKPTQLWIIYTATVNENAVEVISKNEAKLSYGNDPDHLENGEPSVVRVFSSNIEVLKYAKNQVDAEDTSKVLAGAEFVLQNSTGEGDAAVPGGKYYKATTKTAEDSEEVTNVEWVDSIDDATHVTTGEDGLAYFKGLENGTYYLVETKAPAGYNLLGANDADGNKITEKGEVKVVVETFIQEGEGGAWVGVPADFTAHEKVANSAGSLLPSTGGIGTTIFYVLGSVLLVVAAAWFVISRRRAQTEEK